MKKIISMFLSALLVVGLYIPALAVDSTEDGFDTLSLSMDDYHANMRSKVSFLQAVSKQDIVENVCKSFISVGRASVRSPDYSIAAFSDLSQAQVKYRQSEYQYLSALYNITDVDILSDNMMFDDFDVKFDGTSAVASIVEKYTYYTNDFDGYNFRMRKYTFTLDCQEDDSWVITGIVTDDPWETTSFSYEPYNVEDIPVIAYAEIPADVNAEKNRVGNKTAAMASGLYKWTYNTSAAVEYASRFCNATSKTGGNNPLFPFTYSASGAEANCQNFASQCVWAGLIGNCDTAVAMTSRTTIPAVSASRVGSSATNVWCYDSRSVAPAIDGYTWYSSTRFAKMIKLSNTTTEGPFGNTHYGNLKYADVGDVIHINWDRITVTENSTLQHAMFVTGATGSVGSRTVANLKIAANSSPTNTAYVSLSSYASGYTDESFSTCVINAGYYSSPRNFN